MASILDYFWGHYVSDRGLKNLDSYKYAGEDHSWFAAHGLTTFWNWATELFPMWVAPNVITLSGGFCNVIYFTLWCIYGSATIDGVAPSWVYFASAALIFIYLSLDNIDGKQARRTGASSALGELMDHVVDALCVGIHCITISHSATLGPYRTFVVCIATMVPFYLHHWDEYFTGCLILGQFDGPNESLLGLSFIHTFNGLLVVFGVHETFWQGTFFGGEFFQGTIVANMVTTQALTVGFVCLATLSTIGLTIKTWKVVIEKNIDYVTALRVPLPMAIFMVWTSIYLYNIPELMDLVPVIPLSAISLVFGYLTSRLIVQRVTGEPTIVLYWRVYVPMALATFNAGVGELFMSNYNASIIFLVLAFSEAIGFYCGMAVQLSTYLKIPILTLPQKGKKRGKAVHQSNASLIVLVVSIFISLAILAQNHFK